MALLKRSGLSDRLVLRRRVIKVPLPLGLHSVLRPSVCLLFAMLPSAILILLLIAIGAESRIFGGKSHHSKEIHRSVVHNLFGSHGHHSNEHHRSGSHERRFRGSRSHENLFRRHHSLEHIFKGSNSHQRFLKSSSESHERIIPRVCVVSEWSTWTVCSAKCDGGYQHRWRKVVSPNAQNCPVLDDSRRCNIQTCASAICKVSLWSAWSDCSAECGFGQQSRWRKIISSGTNGVCPPLDESQPCYNICDTECKLSNWSDWSGCQTASTCGSAKGVQKRWRKIVSHPTGGNTCANLDESRNCVATNPPCDQPCLLGQWSEWDFCSKSCGSGSQHRKRQVIRPSVGNGVCPVLDEIRPCNQQQCDPPIVSSPCRVGFWENWSVCSSSCGSSGIQIRHRQITSEAVGSGQCSCPALVESRKCNENIQCDVPVDCLVNDWSEWTKCSADCGSNGFQSRWRKVLSNTISYGQSCPVLDESRSCNSQPCDSNCQVACFDEDLLSRLDIECKLSNWSDWSSCQTASTCGSAKGVQKRWRKIVSHPTGGNTCANLDESRNCVATNPPCDSDCQVSSWSSFGPCSVQCGSGGKKDRFRTVLSQPIGNGATKCPHLSETVPCQADKPCDVPCLVGSWGAFGSCSVSCGGGSRSRHRQILQNPVYNGCPPLYETEKCNQQQCGHNCRLSEWTKWSECSAQCGTPGKKDRFRTVLVPAVANGICEGHLSETVPCQDKPCDVRVECSMSEWSHWSDCGSCGITNRFRTILVQPIGSVCPHTSETLPCSTTHKPTTNPPADKPSTKPPVNCIVSEWSHFMGCSAECNGKQSRWRTVVSNPTGNPLLCPILDESVPCNTDCAKTTTKAPLDVPKCQYGQWSSWSSCNCDLKIQTRSRSVLSTSAANCHDTQQSQRCSSTCTTTTEKPTTKPPVNCKVGEWLDWSACKCGGSQSRHRKIISQANAGGAPCPVLDENRPCGTAGCNDIPSPCVLMDWSEWSSCSASCNGNQYRWRKVVSAPTGKQTCPPADEKRSCNTQSCSEKPTKPTKAPLDVPKCSYGQWSSWSSCSATCEGIQTRSRSVSSPTAANCNDTQQSQKCSSACNTTKKDTNGNHFYYGGRK